MNVRLKSGAFVEMSNNAKRNNRAAAIPQSEEVPVTAVPLLDEEVENNASSVLTNAPPGPNVNLHTNNGSGHRHVSPLTPFNSAVSQRSMFSNAASDAGTQLPPGSYSVGGIAEISNHGFEIHLHDVAPLNGDVNMRNNNSAPISSNKTPENWTSAPANSPPEFRGINLATLFRRWKLPEIRLTKPIQGALLAVYGGLRSLGVKMGTFHVSTFGKLRSLADIFRYTAHPTLIRISEKFKTIDLLVQQAVRTIIETEQRIKRKDAGFNAQNNKEITIELLKRLQRKIMAMQLEIAAEFEELIASEPSLVELLTAISSENPPAASQVTELAAGITGESLSTAVANATSEEAVIQGPQTATAVTANVRHRTRRNRRRAGRRAVKKQRGGSNNDFDLRFLSMLGVFYMAIVGASQDPSSTGIYEKDVEKFMRAIEKSLSRIALVDKIIDSLEAADPKNVNNVLLSTAYELRSGAARAGANIYGSLAKIGTGIKGLFTRKSNTRNNVSNSSSEGSVRNNYFVNGIPGNQYDPLSAPQWNNSAVPNIFNRYEQEQAEKKKKGFFGRLKNKISSAFTRKKKVEPMRPLEYSSTGPQPTFMTARAGPGHPELSRINNAFSANNNPFSRRRQTRKN